MLLYLPLDGRSNSDLATNIGIGSTRRSNPIPYRLPSPLHMAISGPSAQDPFGLELNQNIRNSTWNRKPSTRHLLKVALVTVPYTLEDLDRSQSPSYYFRSMWQHHYARLAGNLPLSALVAAIPFLTLPYLLGVRRKAAWSAVLYGPVATAVTAVLKYSIRLAHLIGITYGAYGLFPIGSWVGTPSIRGYCAAVSSRRNDDGRGPCDCF